MTHAESTRTYYLIFAALLLGTALTVAVTYVDLGRLNLIIALTIAFTKATLVVLFFMHVRQSSALTKLYVVAGLFWMFLLILLTFSDYMSRDWLPIPRNWSPGQERTPDVLH